MTQKLRLGILSAANIARSFIKGCAGSDLLSIDAVASRDEAKAAAFAAETGVPRHHGSYRSLLADPAIDAVYIPLPNDMHAVWAIRAAEAGKHALCEKPLAKTLDDVRTMVAAVEAAVTTATPDSGITRAVMRRGRRTCDQGRPGASQPPTRRGCHLSARGAERPTPDGSGIPPS